MAHSQVPTVEPSHSAAHVRRLFRSTGARIIVVVEKEKFAGVIYRTSILMLTSTKTNALARDIMEDPPFRLMPQESIGEAIRTMLKYDEWYGVVTEGNRYVGVLGLENVIELALNEMEEELAKAKVEDVMSRDVVAASPDDFISSIWRKMVEHRYAGLPVVDEKGRVLGMITQFDLIRKGYSRIELESEGGARRGPRVREAMTHGAVYVYPWTPLSEAARIMVTRGYGRLPVVDAPKTRRLIGIIDREDVVRFVMGGGRGG